MNFVHTFLLGSVCFVLGSANSYFLVDKAHIVKQPCIQNFLDQHHAYTLQQAQNRAGFTDFDSHYADMSKPDDKDGIYWQRIDSFGYIGYHVPDNCFIEEGEYSPVLWKKP